MRATVSPARTSETRGSRAVRAFFFFATRRPSDGTEMTTSVRCGRRRLRLRPGARTFGEVPERTHAHMGRALGVSAGENASQLYRSLVPPESGRLEPGLFRGVRGSARCRGDGTGRVGGRRGGSARGWRTATRKRSGRVGSGRVEPETRPCGVLTRRAETRRGGSYKHITESARTKSETSSDASPTKNISGASAPSSPFTPSQVAIPPSRVAKETRDGGYSRRCVSRRRARPARPGLGRAPAAWG